MQDTVQSRFGHRAVFIMSIIQISCGVLSIVIGGVQIKEDQMLGDVGYGMWTGFFFIIAGILGITSWNFKNSGNIIAHMVMSIIACIFGWILFGIAVPSVAYASYGYSCSDTSSYYSRGYSSYYSRCAAPIALGVILVIISLLEIVVSIVSSAYCCRAVCCGVHSSTPGTVVQYNVPPRGQAVVMAPGVYPQHGYVMPAGQQGGQVIYLNQSAPVQMPVHQGQVSYQVQAVPAMGMHVQNQPAMVTVPFASSHTSTVVSPAGVQPSVASANASASPNNPPVCNTLDNSKTKEGNFEYTRLDE